MFLEACSYLIRRFDQKEISSIGFLRYNVDLYNRCSVLTRLLSDQPKVTMPPSEKTSNVMTPEGTQQRHPASLENAWVTQWTPQRGIRTHEFGKNSSGGLIYFDFFSFTPFFSFEGLKKIISIVAGKAEKVLNAKHIFGAL